MDGTSADCESVAAEFAAGCQIVAFTSGQGNPIGFPGCPVIKICSNTLRLAALGGKGGDMDLDAGASALGVLSADALHESCVREILKIAGGRKTASELRRHDGSLFEFQFRKPAEKRPVLRPVCAFC